MTYASRSGVQASARAALSMALFAGATGLALAPGAVFAAESAPAASANGEDATTVAEVVVTGRSNEPDSPKYTAPLLDTPQTITVVPAAVIEAQNLLTLRDILSTVPGITFGAGEGGGGYGDSINLRGYAASSDITVDGVRDSAQYTRSDPFNLEQIEVANGANGVYAGTGSVGGSINLVSKQPVGRDMTAASLGVGTHDYRRGTLDANKTLGASVAVRLNAMAHRNDVPGRDVEQFRRWGVAPSITFGLGSATTATLSYFHQTDDNVPQYGVPYVFNTFRQGVVPGADLGAYYGFRNIDTQQIDVDSLTLRLDHEFSDALSIRNLTRYQVVDQFSIVSQPQGTFCLANGLNAATNAACTTPGVFLRNVSGTTRDTRNTSLYSQTDLKASFETGPLSHTLVAGVALLSETFRLDNGASLRSASGAVPAAGFLTTTIAAPDSLYAGPVNFIQSGASDGERRNQAVYVFDTVRIGEQWEVNGGLRLERNEGSNRTGVYSTTAPLGVVTPGPTLRNAETLFSYRLGLVFKPVPNASLYAAYGNAETPSQSAVNGACTITTCNVDPELAKIYELGGKWDVLDSRLSLTASAFRNERANYKVPSNDPTIPDQVLEGKSRVDGIALGAAGRVTKALSVFANYTWLDSEVVRGCAVAGCVPPTPPATTVDPTGKPLTATPEHSGSAWITYDLSKALQFGYGLTHVGSTVLSNTLEPAPGVLYTAPGYTVHRASVTWKVSRQAELRLNVNNVADAQYLTRIRTSANGWATPGEARNATLTLNYRF